VYIRTYICIHFSFFVCFFVVIKPENLYFVSRPGIEVKSYICIYIMYIFLIFVSSFFLFLCTSIEVWFWVYSVFFSLF